MEEKEIMQKVSEVAGILKGCNHFEKEKRAREDSFLIRIYDTQSYLDKIYIILKINVSYIGFY